MDLVVVLGLRPGEELPWQCVQDANVRGLLQQPSRRTTTIYVRIGDYQENWHLKASCALPFRIQECTSSDISSGTFSNNAGAYDVLKSCQFPEIDADVAEATMVRDDRLLQSMQNLCGRLAEVQGTEDRQRKRRLQKAGQNLAGILQARQGPAPTLMSVAQKQSFLTATASYLQDLGPDNSSEMPNLGTWCTVATSEFGAWLKPGVPGDTRQVLLLLLRQLQQKAHFAVQHGLAQPVKGALVRTTDHRRTDGQHVARLLMLEDAGSTTAKNCYMWVCPRVKLETALREGAADVWGLGSLHVVVGSSNMRGSQLSLQPAFSDEFSEGTEVCTVQLADIHEFVFLFHAIVAACRTRPPASALQTASKDLLSFFGDAPASPAFRAWMGIGPVRPETAIWNQLLGVNREELFKFAESQLGLHLTMCQQDIMRQLNGVVAVINNFAGGGKTTLLAVIASYIIQQFQERAPGSRPLVFFMSTTKKVVQDFVAELQGHVPLEATAMLGFEESEGDLFQKYLQEAADRMFTTFAKMYGKLDAIIGQIHHWLLNMVVPVLTEPGKYLRLALLLLQWRGYHLQNVVYSQIYRIKQEAVQKVALIGSTTSYMAKLAASNIGWARSLKERRKLILLQDECMGEPAERQAVNLLDFEAVLLAGDPHQCVAQRPQLSPNAASLAQLGPRAERPLQWHPCLTWLENHRHTQRILNHETFRTGEPAMSFLKAVFGNEMLGECISKANHSTAVIPVLFWEVWDWIPGGSGECQRSLTIFSAIAFVLAAEVLKSLQTAKPSNVVITAFLLTQLRALEAFLHTVVPQLCLAMQGMAGLEGVTADQIKGVMQLWQFRGPYSVGGANSDVAICLGVRRQVTDKAWRGLALEKPLIYTALTRAKHRQYLFFEDLRGEVVLPHRGTLAATGRALGLRNFAIPTAQLNATTVESHLLWTRALWSSVEIFQRDFDRQPWWSCRPETPWLFWSPKWRGMMGLQGPSAWPDMMCLVASTFDEMIWPDEGGEDGELAATFFRHITLPQVSPTGNRPVPSAKAFQDRILARPRREVVLQFWSSMVIDNLAVSYGTKDAVVQMPLMAYMSPEAWARLLLPDEAADVREAVIDPNYAAEILVARALDMYTQTPEARDKGFEGGR